MIVALKHPELFTDKVSWATLKQNVLVSKITKGCLPGVATSSKGLFQEESNLPMVHSSDGFDQM